MVHALCSFLTCGCKSESTAPILKSLSNRNHRRTNSESVSSRKAAINVRKTSLKQTRRQSLSFLSDITSFKNVKRPERGRKLLGKVKM